jgi:hypothetical protein
MLKESASLDAAQKAVGLLARDREPLPGDF